MDANDREPRRELPVPLDMYFGGTETTCPLCGGEALDAPQALRIVGPAAVVSECERDPLTATFRNAHPACLAEYPALASMAYETGPLPTQLSFGTDSISVN